MEDWKACEGMAHVGDERDETVTWRDLGLLCDTCFAARVDVREVRAAVVEHFEAWTSVNSGNLRRNAYPRDLALWEAFGLIERETRDA